MGCYQARNNEGIASYSEEKQKEILSAIDNKEVEKLKEHFKSGFRFQHKFKQEFQVTSYLNYALKKGSAELLKNNNLTVDPFVLSETVQGNKIVFSYILADEELVKSLCQAYGEEYICSLDSESNKKLIDLFMNYEKSGEVWKKARVVFNISAPTKKEEALI